MNFTLAYLRHARLQLDTPVFWSDPVCKESYSGIDDLEDSIASSSTQATQQLGRRLLDRYFYHAIFDLFPLAGRRHEGCISETRVFLEERLLLGWGCTGKLTKEDCTSFARWIAAQKKNAR